MVNWFINNSGAPHTETICILNVKCEVKSDISLNIGRWCFVFFSGYENKDSLKECFTEELLEKLFQSSEFFYNSKILIHSK